MLSDGGVYDNLGLETAWKRYDDHLVSDGGGKMAPEPKPTHDWARHALRILGVIDNQVRNLRKRQVVAGFLAWRPRKGAYWGIRTDIGDYGRPPARCPARTTSDAALATHPTRLAAMPTTLQERLINWGYAVCDAGHAQAGRARRSGAAGFPYAAASGRAPCQTTGSRFPAPSFGTCVSSRAIPA